MPEQDIYKLVEQLNKNKTISSDKKIDDIFNLLDDVKKQEQSEIKLKKNSDIKLTDLKEKTKPIIRPPFPSIDRPFEKRSDCFLTFLQQVDYGDNNPHYKKGHKEALEKYYVLASNNKKDFFVLEGQIRSEIEKYQRIYKDDYFNKGFYDGLLYVEKAFEKSKELTSKKISEELMKELD